MDNQCHRTRAGQSRGIAKFGEIGTVGSKAFEGNRQARTPEEREVGRDVDRTIPDRQRDRLLRWAGDGQVDDQRVAARQFSGNADRGPSNDSEPAPVKRASIESSCARPSTLRSVTRPSGLAVADPANGRVPPASLTVSDQGERILPATK